MATLGVDQVKKRASEEGNRSLIICSAMEAEIYSFPKPSKMSF